MKVNHCILLASIASISLIGCSSDSDDPEGLAGRHAITIIDPAAEEDMGMFDRSFAVEDGDTFFYIPAVFNIENASELVSVESIAGCGGLKLVEGTVDEYESPPINGSCTVTVNYVSKQPDVHLVKVQQSGYGGEISPVSLSVYDGEKARFPVSVQDGYTLAITGCGAQVQGDSVITESIHDHCTIEALYEPSSSNTANISTIASIGGNIYPVNPLVAVGDSVEFDIKTGIGFVANISGCGGSLDQQTYVIDEVREDCVVNAEFSQIDRTNAIVTVVGNGALELIEADYTDPDEFFSYMDKDSAYLSQPLIIESEIGFILTGRSGKSITGVDSTCDAEDTQTNVYPTHADVLLIQVKSDCQVEVLSEDSVDKLPDFHPDANIVNVTVLGEGGSVEPQIQTRFNGSAVMFKVSPDQGYTYSVSPDFEYELCDGSFVGDHYITSALHFCEYTVEFYQEAEE